MTEIRELVERLQTVLSFYSNAWQWDGENPETTAPSGDLQDDLGARARDFLHDDMPDLWALSEKVERMEAENAEALDIMAEFKAEIAKLAESDPEISEQDRRRFAVQGAAARYREMARLSLTDNISLRSQAKVLREVLRPFARLAEAIRPNVPDDEIVVDALGDDSREITVGQFRRARQALASHQPETGSAKRITTVGGNTVIHEFEPRESYMLGSTPKPEDSQ